MNELGFTVPIMGLCYGPLGILEMLRSAEKLFMDCIRQKEAVIQGLEIITEVLVDFIKAQAKTGVHAIILTTLFAANSIMSKKLWMETEGPFVRRLADTIRACGPMVAVHNCAEGPYFDMMIETMNPVILSVAHKADGCKDWMEVKQKWGSKVCLYGYMDPANILYLGTPDQVRQECRKEIEELGQGGGFILGPGCEFPPNASLLNAMAMMDGAKIFGQHKNTGS
jgi:uroporphyrinogen decarboxylase